MEELKSKSKHTKKLTYYYSKKEQDFVASGRNSYGANSNLLLDFFSSARTVFGTTLLQELENRGFNLKTIKFSITD